MERFARKTVAVWIDIMGIGGSSHFIPLEIYRVSPMDISQGTKPNGIVTMRTSSFKWINITKREASFRNGP